MLGVALGNIYVVFVLRQELQEALQANTEARVSARPDNGHDLGPTGFGPGRKGPKERNKKQTHGVGIWRCFLRFFEIWKKFGFTW